MGPLRLQTESGLVLPATDRYPVPIKSTGVTRSLIVPTSGAYGANDIVGGPLVVPLVNSAEGRPVKLNSLQITDQGNNSAALLLFFFPHKLADSTGVYLDNGAVTWGSTDYACGDVVIATGNWTSIGSRAFVNFSGLAQQLHVQSRDLGLLMLCTGTPTFNSRQLQITLGFEHQ